MRIKKLLERWNKVNEVEKGHLYGAGGSLEQLLKGAQKNFYSDSLKFKQADDNVWSVEDSNGERPELIVVKKGNRYRLEASGKPPKKITITKITGSGHIESIGADDCKIKDISGKEYHCADIPKGLKVGDAVTYDVVNQHGKETGFVNNIKK